LRCTADGCGHRFCGLCLSRHVQLAARRRAFPVRCPQPGCRGTEKNQTCSVFGPVPWHDSWWCVAVRFCVLSYSQLEVESSLPQPLRFYCPNPECSLLMVLDVSGEHLENSPVRCPGCRAQLCGRCRVLWHIGVSCEQYRAMQVRLGAGSSGGGGGGGDEAALAGVSGERVWKPCPQCRQLVEMAQGCNHITCKCGAEWCYKCGA
ncbi:hypothetical protein VOLCADRAFT_46019, partial [Volvox carteri f. nagariensis]